MRTAGKSRREFLAQMAALGAWPLWAGNAWAGRQSDAGKAAREGSRLDYQARTVSIAHFAELQNFIDTLRRDDKISHNKIYRSYIDARKFAVPADFPGATSVVILAYRTPMLRFNVHYRGRPHEVILSPQYFDDGVTRADLEAAVRRDIVKDPAAKLKIGRAHV